MVLPIILIAGIEIILFLTNVQPGTFLTGWDNLHPEFSIWEHVWRSIYGVWMEYRGLGLYDGQSHIANLLHTLSIGMLSIALPQNLLRYVFMFGTHLAGGIGAYFLLRKLFHAQRPLMRAVLSLLGSLFYLFNIATVQMYYVPLEAFAVHFAALPWLAYTLISYLPTGSKKALLGFFLTVLFSTPQFFIPTLILPAILVLNACIITYAAVNISKHPKTTLKRIGISLAGFLFINAFWLLPYLYGLPGNAPIISQAKINQISSSDVYDRNRAFGNITDVLLLRGLHLSFEDSSTTDTAFFLMAPWRRFIYNPPFVAISAFLALFALIGMASTVQKKHWGFLPFSLMFLSAFLFLGNDIPLIREGMDALRAALPFVGEAYRFPFTKFILLLALSYAVLVPLGVLTVTHWIAGELPALRLELAGGIILLLAYTTIPSWQGNFLYTNLRVTPPEDYQQFFRYMQQADKTARTAILPQPSHWSWKHYDFGYRGSGFIWEGIPQPLMDRAFDPWSQFNEQYYWELRYALYKKDAFLLEQVLDKYDVSFLVLDEHIIATSNQRTLYVDEAKTLLAEIPSIQEIKAFGKITLYARSDADTTTHIGYYDNLPTAGPVARWMDEDMAHTRLGTYISSHDTQTDAIFPYRSLFTKRSVDERTFSIKETAETIEIVPLRHNGDATASSAITVSRDRVYDTNDTRDLETAQFFPCGLLSTGVAQKTPTSDSVRLTTRGNRGCMSFGLPNTPHTDGYLVLVESRHIEGRPILFSLINKTARHTEIETYLPTDNELVTSAFILPPLATDGVDYTVYVTNDATGAEQTVNDLGRIHVYRLEYEDLVQTMVTSGDIQIGPTRVDVIKTVTHPNPSLYEIKIERKEQGVLVLSQAFHDGWIALQKTDTWPFFQPIGGHVLINNWKNGWKLPQTMNDSPLTIYVLFWPQILEFLGFGLTAIPFILLFMKRKKT